MNEMKKVYEIKSRWNNKILFSIEATSMKLAVEAAVKAGTDLSWADLSRADLYGANLSMANLSRADLTRAELSRADLYGANLFGASLYEANLCCAELSCANLSEADLSMANLSKADLSGTKLTDDIELQKTPIQLFGLRYQVIIWDEHIKIGCEFHSMADWFSFDDKSIAEMDGKAALKFWHQWKEPIRQICIADGRYKMEDRERNG